MPLKGVRELQNRLDAVADSFVPIGEDWAERCAAEYGNRVRRNTGRLSRSFRVGDTGDTEATVVGHFTAKFEDAGAKPHPIKSKPLGKRMKFQKQGRPVFAKAVRHPGMKGTGFRDDGASAALDRVPMADHAVKLWNGAA